MMDSVSCDINAVESYKRIIIDYYKEQLYRFEELKNKFEKSKWNDEVKLERMNQINTCLKKIADAIDQITNGISVSVVDRFLSDAYDYIETRKNYPK